MQRDRRRYSRVEAEGRVEIRRFTGGPHTVRVPVYLRDTGPGGLSGTCFGGDVPGVDELLLYDLPDGTRRAVRVAWSFSAIEDVHMLGLEFVGAAARRNPREHVVHRAS